MIIALCMIIGLYCFLLVVLIVGWYKVPMLKKNQNGPTLVYSVIIPVRNEEKDILNLCEALVRQNFPTNHFEVIFIDDHSEDTSYPLIDGFIERDDSGFDMRVETLKVGRGKKAALEFGVGVARGEVIITTDADCQMGTGWIWSISQYFEAASTEMVCGPVVIRPAYTFFEKLQVIEFGGLIGTGAASLALGAPNMCNGANLSFRKSAFYEVNGYAGNEAIASGDDEFLMHKFHRKFPGRLLFNKLGDGLVWTRPHKNWFAFFQQRKRWASKWKYYSSFKISFLAIFIFLYNLSVIAALFFLIRSFYDNQWLLMLIIAKLILEATFLAGILNFLGKKLNIFLFIFLQFTYPFYVIITGIAANFGKYTWKGRRY